MRPGPDPSAAYDGGLGRRRRARQQATVLATPLSRRGQAEPNRVAVAAQGDRRNRKHPEEPLGTLFNSATANGTQAHIRLR